MVHFNRLKLCRTLPADDDSPSAGLDTQEVPTQPNLEQATLEQSDIELMEICQHPHRAEEEPLGVKDSGEWCNLPISTLQTYSEWTRGRVPLMGGSGVMEQVTY